MNVSIHNDLFHCRKDRFIELIISSGLILLKFLANLVMSQNISAYINYQCEFNWNMLQVNGTKIWKF